MNYELWCVCIAVCYRVLMFHQEKRGSIMRTMVHLSCMKCPQVSQKDTMAPKITGGHRGGSLYITDSITNWILKMRYLFRICIYSGKHHCDISPWKKSIKLFESYLSWFQSSMPTASPPMAPVSPGVEDPDDGLDQTIPGWRLIAALHLWGKKLLCEKIQNMFCFQNNPHRFGWFKQLQLEHVANLAYPCRDLLIF
jgi:hypothetical protein